MLSPLVVVVHQPLVHLLMVFKEPHQCLDLDLYLLLVVVMVEMELVLELVVLVVPVVEVENQKVVVLEPISLVQHNKDTLVELDIQQHQHLVVVVVVVLVVLEEMEHHPSEVLEV